MDSFGHRSADVLRDSRLLLAVGVRRAQPLPEEAHLSGFCLCNGALRQSSEALSLSHRSSHLTASQSALPTRSRRSVPLAHLSLPFTFCMGLSHLQYSELPPIKYLHSCSRLGCPAATCRLHL